MPICRRMHDSFRIPLYFPRINELNGKSIQVLAGDVGGTKTNLALWEARDGSIDHVLEATYHSADFPSYLDIQKRFYAEHPETRADRICLGVAGPVFNGKVELTNLNWILNADEIRDATGVDEVSLINDLEATAYGLASLDDEDLILIHEGDVVYPGNMAIIAPGTGLGEGGLFWDGTVYHPFPTEGGHTDFGPRTREDIQLYNWLAKRYGIVSWERVISGPAIFDIYEFLRETAKRKEPDWLRDALKQGDPSAHISQLAMEEKDPVCMETMQNFVRYLARESSNLVLTMKATGGLFLGGGIPPKIAPLLLQNIYYRHFLDADRMQNLLKKVPVKIIQNSKTPMIGAALYGAYGKIPQNK